MGKRLNYTASITEEASDLHSLIKREPVGMVRDRLRFLHLLKSGACLSQGEASARLGLSTRSGQRIWSMYKQGGLAGVYPVASRRGFGKLSSIELAKVLQRLDGDDIQTQSEIAQWISDNFGVSYSQSGIHRLMARLKVKAKTGRPSNVRKREGEVEAFQKNFMS